MFTGLIEQTGTVTGASNTGVGVRLTLRPDSDADVKIGESVSVNGVCLTVVEKNRDVSFEISPVTVKNTNLGTLKVGDRVNLEYALRPFDRLGGHIVTGHVDGTGSIIGKKPAGEYTHYTFSASPDILRYTVKKGSIAVDGISLTVVELDNRSFSVAIIPHTLAVTNLGDKGVGDTVNLEVDILGKYVEKFLMRSDSDHKLEDLLKEKGFTQ